MNVCKQCGKEITNPSFCNSSCAATYNNSRRKWPKEIKDKISNSLKGKKYTGERLENSRKAIERINELRKLGLIKGKPHYTGPKIIEDTCKICKNTFNKPYNSTRSTCCRECRTIAIFKGRDNYKNGSRKNIKYNNKGIIVNLESTWELLVAEKLDGLNINWVRPKHIVWVDSNNITHNYYPDFYLPEYNIYLDPKNEYCMSKDKEKMDYVKDKINLIYGDIKIILSFIENVVK